MAMGRQAVACGGGHEGGIGLTSVLAIGLVLSVLAGQGFGQEKATSAPAPTSQPASSWLDLGRVPTKETRGGDGGTEPVALPEWKKPVPFGILVEYTLVSDYICRKGLNLSEYPGEGREKPNHQLLVAPSVSTKDMFGKGSDLGTFSLPMWFEWYAGQQHLTPWDSSDFQEVDFMPTWTYAIPKTPLTFSFTWDGYLLPRLKDLPGGKDSSFGQEVWFGLAFDDSAIFGKPLFSPYVTYVLDVDDNRGSWIDLGIKHDFKLSEMGLKAVPVIKDLTVTPGVVFGIDHRYVDKIVGNDLGTHFSTINYGLSSTYDLNGGLNIPRKYGSFYIKGFINFKEQVHDYQVHGPYPVLRDELYGGVSFGYSW